MLVSSRFLRHVSLRDGEYPLQNVQLLCISALLFRNFFFLLLFQCFAIWGERWVYEAQLKKCSLPCTNIFELNKNVYELAYTRMRREGKSFPSHHSARSSLFDTYMCVHVIGVFWCKNLPFCHRISSSSEVFRRFLCVFLFSCFDVMLSVFWCGLWMWKILPVTFTCDKPIDNCLVKSKHIVKTNSEVRG